MNSSFKQNKVPKEVIEKVDWYIDNLNSLELTDPIFITSKGNREKTLCRQLDKFSSPVFLFIDESEFESFGYDKLEKSESVEIVKLKSEECASLQRKRKAIQDFSRSKGFKRYFMLDDDISYTGYIANIDREGQTKNKIPIDKLCAIMQHYYKDKDFSVSGPTIMSIVCGSCSSLEGRQTNRCFFYVNDEFLQKHNIGWNPRSDLIEDLVLAYDCHQAGLMQSSLNFLLKAATYAKYDELSDRKKQLIMNTWVYLKGYYKPRLMKTSNDIIQFSRCKGENTFEQTYKVVGDNYEKLLNYLKNQNKPFWQR